MTDILHHLLPINRGKNLYRSIDLRYECGGCWEMELNGNDVS